MKNLDFQRLIILSTFSITVIKLTVVYNTYSIYINTYAMNRESCYRNYLGNGNIRHFITSKYLAFID